MKLFVLDTNVLLYDVNSMFSFDDNVVIIPIVVLEELDNLKKGSHERNYAAREVVRKLTELMESSKDGISQGIKLDNGGKLYVLADGDYNKVISHSFTVRTNDHSILSLTQNLQDNKIPKFGNVDNLPVILVTKDINLRAKALSISLNAENYLSGAIEELHNFIKPTLEINVEAAAIDKLYTEKKMTVVDMVSSAGGSLDSDINRLFENQYFLMKHDRKSALCKLKGNIVVLVSEKKKVFGMQPLNAEQTFLMDALLDDKIKVVAVTGKAGTGKTLVALASALEKFKEKTFETIMMARPDVSLSDKPQGFLPGDIHEKIAPFMLPLFDNLDVIRKANRKSSNAKSVSNMQEKKQLIIEPLATIRGRSLSDTFFIIDESQNLTPHEIKTIITRAGEGTKIIVTGDINQIDASFLDKKSNGLSHLISKMRGEKLFAHVNLIKSERSELSEIGSRLL